MQFDLQLHAGILWLTAIGVPVIKPTTSMLWFKPSAQSVWAAGVAHLMHRAAQAVALLDEGTSPIAAAHTKLSVSLIQIVHLAVIAPMLLLLMDGTRWER
jgi:hypothetical protein